MYLDLAAIAFGAFLGAVVIGSAGFAFAIVVTGIWIYVLPPVTLVFLTSICATLLHAVNLWKFRRDIQYRLLWPFLVGGVLGVPIGVAVLAHTDTMLFRHMFGAFMILYGGYMLSRPHVPVILLAPAAGRLSDAVVGWASGILGGLAMLNGVLTTIWCSLRGWDKRKSRCVYQPYIGFTSIIVMLVLGLNADVKVSRFGLYLAACLPGLALGLWIGLRIFDWVSEEGFRKLVLVLIFASGIALQF